MRGRRNHLIEDNPEDTAQWETRKEGEVLAVEKSAMQTREPAFEGFVEVTDRYERKRHHRRERLDPSR